MKNKIAIFVLALLLNINCFATKLKNVSNRKVSVSFNDSEDQIVWDRWDEINIDEYIKENGSLKISLIEDATICFIKVFFKVDKIQSEYSSDNIFHEKSVFNIIDSWIGDRELKRAKARTLNIRIDHAFEKDDQKKE